MLAVSYFIAIALGVFAGIFTGLTPGIHINLLSVLLVSMVGWFSKYFDFVSLSCFVIAMSVTHSFLDSIPSIFLGAPEEATALGVLPGHRYLHRGNGLMAVKLTIIGSLGALVLSVLLFPLLVPIVSFLYPLIKDYIGYLLILVVVFMILRDRKKLWALFVFFLSGTFGIIVFNLPNFSNPLFPMLSGLFGVSTLLMSLKDTNVIPKQNDMQVVRLRWPLLAKALGAGQFSGWLTSMFPGLGASTAAVIGLQMVKKLGDHGFMVLMGSINTVNFILSMVTLYSLDKARNGSIIAVQKIAGFFGNEISLIVVVVFLLATLISGGISAVLALKIGRWFSVVITKVNYQMLLLSIIGFIIVLCGFLTGGLGLFVLLVSTAIGFISPIVKVTRTHAMGCLLLPVIMYFVL